MKFADRATSDGELTHAGFSVFDYAVFCSYAEAAALVFSSHEEHFSGERVIVSSADHEGLVAVLESMDVEADVNIDSAQQQRIDTERQRKRRGDRAFLVFVLGLLGAVLVIWFIFIELL